MLMFLQSQQGSLKSPSFCWVEGFAGYTFFNNYPPSVLGVCSPPSDTEVLTHMFGPVCFLVGFDLNLPQIREEGALWGGKKKVKFLTKLSSSSVPPVCVGGN